MKKLLLILLISLSTSCIAQENKSTQKVDWNGYAQLRASSNFNDYSSMMVRRLKFWIKSTPDFNEHWSYKVQAIFTSWMQEKFFLQDAKISYKANVFSLDIGQFIPKYSLQWTQSDYLIPSIERAIVVNALHTDGTLGVRDIGVQFNFKTKNNLLETHLGLFNGYGIKEYHFNNNGYMFSHKTAINIALKNKNLQIGYSLQYRQAENLKIPHVLPDTVLFTGIDFRYNFFAMLNSKHFNIQAEYFNADFEGKQAKGYYVLSNVNFRKNQIILGFEDYKDLISETKNSPYFRVGYNYMINKNKMKLFFDNYFQINDSNIDNYIASVQVQMFFK